MFEHLPSEIITSMFSTASAAMVVCIATLVSIPNSLIVALKIDIASMILVFNSVSSFLPFSSVQVWPTYIHYWVAVACSFTCCLLPFELVLPKELADITLELIVYQHCSSSSQAKECLQLVSLTIRTVRTTQDVKEPYHVVLCVCCASVVI